MICYIMPFGAFFCWANEDNLGNHTATHCSALQHTATHCDTLWHTATHCNTLQHTVTHCNTLQHTATHCDTLRHTATHCDSLQHAVTHCNALILGDYPRSKVEYVGCLVVTLCNTVIVHGGQWGKQTYSGPARRQLIHYFIHYFTINLLFHSLMN